MRHSEQLGTPDVIDVRFKLAFKDINPLYVRDITLNFTLYDTTK